MVKVLTKPACQPCIATKRKLEERGIEFEELSITDEVNLELAKELGFLAAPVVILEDGTAFSGYRPDLLSQLVA